MFSGAVRIEPERLNELSIPVLPDPSIPLAANVGTTVHWRARPDDGERSSR